MLSVIAQRTGQRATISIRVNPDVDARTHAEITTGTLELPGSDIQYAYLRNTGFRLIYDEWYWRKRWV